MILPPEEVRDGFKDVLRAKTRFMQKESAEKFTELQRQHAMIKQQQEKLLNMRLADEIDGEVFSRKSVELRERWVTADCAITRKILETLCLNCTLENTNNVATLRSPFEVLRKYPVEKIGRGGGI